MRVGEQLWIITLNATDGHGWVISPHAENLHHPQHTLSTLEDLVDLIPLCHPISSSMHRLSYIDDEDGVNKYFN